MPPEIAKRLPPTVLKAIESGAIDLLWKAMQVLGWAAIIWVGWSIKSIAKEYVSTNIENHPTVLMLKAQEAETRLNVVAAQVGVVEAKASAKEVSIQLDRIERVMTARFDKSDAQVIKLQDRLDRHMDESHSK